MSIYIKRIKHLRLLSSILCKLKLASKPFGLKGCKDMVDRNYGRRDIV